MRVPPLLVVAAVGLWLGGGTPLEAQEVRTVTGTVRSVADSLAIAGVRVRVIGRSEGAESDGSGVFTLRGIPTYDLRLVFERMGFASDTVSLPSGASGVTVYLRPRAVQVSPLVTVSAPSARERFARVAQTSTTTIDPLEIATTPAVAEPDVTRVVQMLPGTVAKNDFTVGLNVRGGENDQNLVRLDGVTVFNPFHIGGLFSTFDAGIVSEVEMLTGAFPAEYGGRLSSVMDVRLRPGDPDRTRVSGAASLLASRVAIDGPLGRTGATYLVGLRRTYADAFADALSDDVFRYHFFDGAAKVRVPLGRGAWLAATGFWGRHALEFEWVEPEQGLEGVEMVYGWGNRLGGLTLWQPIGTWAALTYHLGVSEYRGRVALVPDLTELRNVVQEYSARTALQMRAGPTHDIQLGASLERLHIRYDYESTAIGDQLLELTYDPAIWSGFLEDQWRPVPWLLVRPGVRAEWVTGGADFLGVSPRAAVKVFLSGALALTASVGRYHQAVQSLRDQELPVTYFDSWIGADEHTPVARSDQVVLGVERWFGSAVSLTVEGYAKSFENLALTNVGDDPKVRGDEFLVGTGDAHGVDMVLRRHAGRLSGWIAYSFLKTEREAGGMRFPPAHDRRHTLNVVLQTPGPLGSQLAIRWGYGSPLPYTGIVGQWLHRRYNAELHLFELTREPEALSSEINGERYPYYARLDLGLRWDLELWGGRWRPYLNVLNVLNRRNVFVYTFDYRNVPPTRAGYSQLPIVPSFGLEFEF